VEYQYGEPRTGIPRYVSPSVRPLPGLPATVLIVEDEALVRVLGACMFADEGFRVIEAVSSDEALEFLDADSDVQLLFTDVNLPGTIDGLALARQVHGRWPHIGIIVVSGQSMPQSHEVPEGCRFHRKPYDARSVVRHARELTAA
jgi:CheY-like chemotaxis protein